MVFSPAGSVKLSKAEQPNKAFGAIDVSPLGSVIEETAEGTDRRQLCVLSYKTPSLTEKSELFEDIEKEVSDGHSQKASEAKEFRRVGRETVVKARH